MGWVGGGFGGDLHTAGQVHALPVWFAADACTDHGAWQLAHRLDQPNQCSSAVGEGVQLRRLHGAVGLVHADVVHGAAGRHPRLQPGINSASSAGVQVDAPCCPLLPRERHAGAGCAGKASCCLALRGPPPTPLRHLPPAECSSGFCCRRLNRRAAACSRWARWPGWAQTRRTPGCPRCSWGRARPSSWRWEQGGEGQQRGQTVQQQWGGQHERGGEAVHQTSLLYHTSRC